jgi:hypothetical protein
MVVKHDTMEEVVARTTYVDDDSEDARRVAPPDRRCTEVMRDGRRWRSYALKEQTVSRAGSWRRHLTPTVVSTVTSGSTASRMRRATFAPDDKCGAATAMGESQPSQRVGCAGSAVRGTKSQTIARMIDEATQPSPRLWGKL